MYCESRQKVFGTELKMAVTTHKDVSNMFDMLSAASNITEDILSTWCEVTYPECTQEAMKTRHSI
jgi:hypothetical protein